MSTSIEISDSSSTAYTILTDAPEANANFAWSVTTLMLVTVDAGDAQGAGHTYKSAAPLMLVICWVTLRVPMRSRSVGLSKLRPM